MCDLVTFFPTVLVSIPLLSSKQRVHLCHETISSRNMSDISQIATRSVILQRLTIYYEVALNTKLEGHTFWMKTKQNYFVLYMEINI